MRSLIKSAALAALLALPAAAQDQPRARVAQGELIGTRERDTDAFLNLPSAPHRWEFTLESTLPAAPTDSYPQFALPSIHFRDQIKTVLRQIGDLSTVTRPAGGSDSKQKLTHYV